MSINIWMQLLGFDRDDPDRGAARFLDRTGFAPDNVCALLQHADFVHLHRGMDEEYTLFPDNCAYYAVPATPNARASPGRTMTCGNWSHSSKSAAWASTPVSWAAT